jgi:SAM-dependent methyltransferase
MEDETRSYYDAIAERTADEWYPNNALLPTIRDFLSLLPVAPRILDLGCGPGYESMRLNREGAEVFGVDFSPENIRIARERCPECRFEEADFRRLDDRWGTFDGVFATASLIHISPEEMPDVFAGIAGILNERGKLLAIVQDGEGIRERRPEVDGRQWRRVLYLYSKESLTRLAQPFRFLRDGVLSSDLTNSSWRCYIFEVI